MNGSGWTVFSAVVLVVVLVLAGGYLIIQSYVPPASATPIVPQTRQFRVAMHDFEVGDEMMHHWMPAVLAVNAGDTVILQVTNGDSDSPHGFALGAANILIPSIPQGRTETIRFRAPRPGVYPFGCALAGCARDHAEQSGQLIVLGAP